MICKNCDIQIWGHPNCCPLCGTKLTGVRLRDSAFPEIPPPRQPRRFAFNLVIFITIAAAIISFVINYVTPHDSWWFLFVMGGLGSFWAAFAVALFKRRNIYKLIVWQEVIFILLSFAWDLLTGYNGWSLNFVIPILCASTLIALTIVAKATHCDVRDYLVYLVIGIVTGLFSLIFLLFRVVTIMIPTMICLGTCLIFLSALFVFEGKTLVTELKRRMHI